MLLLASSREVLGITCTCLGLVIHIYVYSTQYGSLARVFVNLRAVLRVNYSLSGRVAAHALLLGLTTHYHESRCIVGIDMKTWHPNFPLQQFL